MTTVGALAASFAMTLTASAQSEIIYNNTTTPLNSAVNSQLEIGDTVTVSGQNRFLSQFQFEYSGTLVPGDGKLGLVRVYSNDGTAGAPGTLLYESDPFSLASGYNTVTIGGIQNVTLPDTITWTFSNAGLGTGEAAGLLLYNAPTIGSSSAAYWEKSSVGVWDTKLLDSGNIVANFSARITAVPEPSVMALGALAGLAMMGANWARRRA
jgi:hypothetical protein